jgi:hypothetical protein
MEYERRTLKQERRTYLQFHSHADDQPLHPLPIPVYSSSQIHLLAQVPSQRVKPYYLSVPVDRRSIRQKYSDDVSFAQT